MIWPRTNSPGVCTARRGGTRPNGLCTGFVSWNVASDEKRHRNSVEPIDTNKNTTTKVGFEIGSLAQEHKSNGDNSEGNFSSQIQETKLEHKLQQMNEQKSNTEQMNNSSHYGWKRPILNEIKKTCRHENCVCVCVHGSGFSGHIKRFCCEQPTHCHANAEGKIKVEKCEQAVAAGEKGDSQRPARSRQTRKKHTCQDCLWVDPKKRRKEAMNIQVATHVRGRHLLR